MAKPQKNVTHPWVQTAVFCDQVLEDTSGAFSAIRIVDQFTMTPPPDWDGKTNFQIPLTALIGFKAGDMKGSRTVRLYHTSPKTQKRKLMMEKEVTFLGDYFGVNMKVNIFFGFKTKGTHWFDVYVDKWLATRMPLTIVFQEAAQAEPPSPSGGSSPQ